MRDEHPVDSDVFARIDDDLTDPGFHLDVLDELVHPAEPAGAVPLASDPDNRYPYVYPRDVAAIVRAWTAAIEAGIRPEACMERVVDAARILLAVQDEQGRWHQRYALDGSDRGIYVQEDNVGHGLRIVADAVFALEATGRLADPAPPLRRSIVEAIEAATDHVRSELYDPNAHLIESTTSIHEGRIESGYTLWVNCTFVDALRRARSALASLPGETADLERSIAEFGEVLEGGVARAFTSLGQVPRRYTPDGRIDDRPDVTLFAPYVFDLGELFGDALHEAAERAASALEDPELGGLQRFLGFHRDFEVHQHGGNGPWMQYTAWHAQYRYDRGEIDRGDEILATIAGYADDGGYIPEHLTTRERFEAFLEREWDTGVDFEKEFDEAVLRDVSFDLVAEELGHVRDAYRELDARLDKREVVGFARPLAWSHAEFLVALLGRNEN